LPTGRIETYLTQVVSECRDLPLRGLDIKVSDSCKADSSTTELAKVYIELNTTGVLESIREKPARADMPSPREKEEPISALQALIEHPRLVLLGDPGSGKSTFVRFISLCLACHQLEPHHGWLKRLPQWPAEWENLIPVRIELRKLAIWMGKFDNDYIEIGLLRGYLNNLLRQLEMESSFEPLLAALEQGGALVMLDGLDEIPANDAMRNKLKELVEIIPQHFPGPLAVTCRVRNYKDDFKWQLAPTVWAQTELDEFNQKQIDAFITAWYNQLTLRSIITENEKDRQIRDLHEAVRRPDILRMARKPLLLTIISLTHSHYVKLPDTRVKLYEEIVDFLLDRWESLKFNDKDSNKTEWNKLLQDAQRQTDDIIKVLSELAFEAYDQIPQNDIAPTAYISLSALLEKLRLLHPKKSYDWADAIVQMIKLRAGLLLEDKDHSFRFPHRTFDEYLAARHLCTLDDISFIKKAVALADKGVVWWEVILLAVGRLVFNSGQNILALNLINELCFGGELSPANKDVNVWRRLWLAGKCLLEIGLNRAQDNKLGKELIEKITRQLEVLISNEILEPHERADAARILGILGDPREGVGLNQNGLPDIAWRKIEKGTFIMGSHDYDREKPQFTCTMIQTKFKISRYPITVAQYQAFINADGYHEKTYWTEAGWKWRQKVNIKEPEKYREVFQTPNHPQVGVSWYEAVAFCNWLGKQLGKMLSLPSEVQWERTSRHTDGRLYPRGADRDVEKRCNMYKTNVGSTAAVGIFPSGDTVSEVADMSGIVWEWCRTQHLKNYSNYENKVNDQLEGDRVRVLRGGSFDVDLDGFRCAARLRLDPLDRDDFVSFRVVSPGL